MNLAPSLATTSANRQRWATLVVVCLAQLMIVLDTTIVNVALPSIQRELHFSQGNLTWVVNAFLITFGSLLLLAGRLGDIVGRRRIFLAGVALFTTASALCGLAASPGMLVAARFLQGIGAAAQSSVILAIIVTEFPEPAERARAMGTYMLVSVAGGSLGLLAGGLLTEVLSWHWIFFVNLPIGLATLSLGHLLIPRDSGSGLRQGVDWLGSLLVTTSLMSGIYAIVQATAHGWGSGDVLGFGALALALMGAFVATELRIENPIMPPRILAVRGVVHANLVRGFLVTAMYSTFFVGTLYLEHVRHYTAIQTGAAFLPWTITVAILSQGIVSGMVNRFGPFRVLIGGMLVAAAGLLLFSSVGPHTAFFPTIFLASFALGAGIGSAFLPLLTIAMAEVAPADAGLGSGIANVSMQVSGALGLALLGTLATNRTKTLLAGHDGLTSALIGGYHLAFLAGTGAIMVGVALAVLLLRPREARPRLSVAGPETDDAQSTVAVELERQAA
ncbi:MAG TPA: MFS transporter [Solirubrobacteraceae bacterium]|nr:MFS transporter [Solirubrobacteraceae bacterium]